MRSFFNNSIRRDVLLVSFSVVMRLIVVAECWQNLTSSIENNCFGTCSRTFTAPNVLPDAINVPESEWVITPLPPSAEEVNEFQHLPLTLTKSNTKLGLGIVKGQPTAERWANQATNSWQLAPDHPRNNKKNCIRLAQLTGETAVEIYHQYKIPSDFYLISAKHVLIHDSGVVALSCGYYQPTEGCETIFKFIGRKWHAKCSQKFRSQRRKWPVSKPSIVDVDIFNSTICRDQSKTMNLLEYEKVFVITSSWDNNYHHFIIDSLIRLSRHINFLKNHSEIKIHIRKYEQYAKKPRYIEGGIELRKRLIDLLGFDENRFISGPILAENVFIPRGAKCNYPISHAYEIRKLTKYMKEQAIKLLTRQPSIESIIKPLVKKSGRLILQHRHCESLEKCEKDWRDWNITTLESFSKALKYYFNTHQMTVLSSGDKDVMNCLHCQIQAYDEADVLVGLHGAGLTNMIFMRPGSLVIEIVGKFDGRMLPLCGYHGSLAAIFGLHHYIFYYDWKGGEKLDAWQLSKESFEFLRFLRRT